MHREERNTHGFTLLELLIAISIFALLSLTAYAALDNAIKQKQIGESQADALRRIQTGLLHMERDLQQAVDRPSNNGLSVEPALEYSTLDGASLRITHIGRSNPLGRPRGNLQRTAYMLKDGAVHRMAWQHLDSLQGEEPQQAILLNNVESMTLRLMDSRRQWKETWPQRNANGMVLEPLPMAVELTLNIKGWGEIRRLIKMVGS